MLNPSAQVLSHIFENITHSHLSIFVVPIINRQLSEDSKPNSDLELAHLYGE